MFGGVCLLVPHLELRWREGEEGEVLVSVGSHLRRGLLPQLRHRAGLPRQGQLVDQTWKYEVRRKATIVTWILACLILS